MRLFFLVLLSIVCAPLWALEQVTLQLNWKHQFQFAGYYAAIEKGYFREAGYEVTLVEAGASHDPIAAVLKGDARFGVGASELALHRARGEPVVALATILQHSPLVLIAGTQVANNVHALSGRRIMLMPHETELYAYLKREGITRYRAEQHSFDPADLISGKVDALSGYSTDEPFVLDKAAFKYAIFTPRSAGIDFYGDTLFTTENAINANRKGVRAFRAAVIKGWEYAMVHPEEIADLILERYSKRHAKDHLLFEAAEMQRLMQPELVEIGHMNEGRWQQIAQNYAELGMVSPNAKIAGLIYEDTPQKLPVWVLPLMAIGVLVIIFVGFFAIYFGRMNRRLEREIVARHEMEQAVQRSEERYRMLAEQSSDVIWTLDLASSHFTYVSPSVQRLRGYTAEEVMAQSMEYSLTPASQDKVRGVLAASLERLAEGDESARYATIEIEQPHKNGGVVSTEVVTTLLLDEAGHPYAVHGITRDMSERKATQLRLHEINEQLRFRLDEIEQLQEALQEQAVRDALTGCFNRRYFDETLERELSRARREGYPLALLMLDLDHFKQINDTYGHQAGDEALKMLVETLKPDIRQEDVFCRYGGEEFVVLMPRMPLAIAADRAERWRQMIADICFKFGNFDLRFTASIGVASYPDHGKVPDELTQFADLALYIAKHEGRNRVVVYEAPTD
jgi:diguanylate cyclase (GGDEF)-like protein/PAS domain S-box-containing protein